MSKAMRRHAFAPERRAAHPGDRDVLPHDVLDAGDAEVKATRAREDGVRGLSSALAEPTAQDNDGLLAQGRASLFPALSVASEVGTAGKFGVLDAYPGELGATQSRPHSDQEQCVVSTTRPG